MRTTLFVLVAALAVGACDQEATAPTASKATLAADQAPGGQIIAIGKTRITATIVESKEEVYGGINNPVYVWSGVTVANCPPGTTAVGGGYLLGGNIPEDMRIMSDGPFPNGWSVSVREIGPPSSTASIIVRVVCVQ